MGLGEWIGGRIIENLDNRGSDNRGSTVPRCPLLQHPDSYSPKLILMDVLRMKNPDSGIASHGLQDPPPPPLLSSVRRELIRLTPFMKLILHRVHCPACPKAF